MKITAELLKQKNACEDQVALFRGWLGDRDGITPTAEDVKSAVKSGLDVGWAAARGILSRAAACGDPWAAYDYARYVDKAPRDDTRAAACGDPWTAYGYASDVDKAPRDDTRAAACGNPRVAYYYASDVDKAPRDGECFEFKEQPEGVDR